MFRLLDVDLDFFLDGVAEWIAKDGPRLDSSEYHPWDQDDVLVFLQDRCLLGRKLPGFVVEQHDELFPLWRQASKPSMQAMQRRAGPGVMDAGKLSEADQASFSE
jgi:hypothetical protein